MRIEVPTLDSKICFKDKFIIQLIQAIVSKQTLAGASTQQIDWPVDQILDWKYAW
jgi:hypothetical protein